SIFSETEQYGSLSVRFPEEKREFSTHEENLQTLKTILHSLLRRGYIVNELELTNGPLLQSLREIIFAFDVRCKLCFKNNSEEPEELALNYSFIRDYMNTNTTFTSAFLYQFSISEHLIVQLYNDFVSSNNLREVKICVHKRAAKWFVAYAWGLIE
ncbi:hypothetical protein PFISCL1PPCAC_1025, partial [Pristionchus fissidentatus]